MGPRILYNFFLEETLLSEGVKVWEDSEGRCNRRPAKAALCRDHYKSIHLVNTFAPSDLQHLATNIQLD